MYYIYIFNIISIFDSYTTSKYEEKFLSIIFNGHADLYFSKFQLVKFTESHWDVWDASKIES